MKDFAFRAGFIVEEIFNLTKINRWFLVQTKEVVDFEEELAKAEIIVAEAWGKSPLPCPQWFVIGTA